jgi:hypothetical protein
MGSFSPLHWLIFLTMSVVFLAVGWVLPIILGIQTAKQKNYSPHWMWFGIHPILGWVACIALLCMTPRIQCPNCGGYVTVNFRVCPYCHAGLDLQSSRAERPAQPPSA